MFSCTLVLWWHCGHIVRSIPFTSKQFLYSEIIFVIIRFRGKNYDVRHKGNNTCLAEYELHYVSSYCATVVGPCLNHSCQHVFGTKPGSTKLITHPDVYRNVYPNVYPNVYSNVSRHSVFSGTITFLKILHPRKNTSFVSFLLFSFELGRYHMPRKPCMICRL